LTLSLSPNHRENLWLLEVAAPKLCLALADNEVLLATPALNIRTTSGRKPISEIDWLPVPSVVVFVLKVPTFIVGPLIHNTQT